MVEMGGWAAGGGGDAGAGVVERLLRSEELQGNLPNQRCLLEKDSR